eukprot:8103237-Lingulodinium_polyedra.AAC.1
MCIRDRKRSRPACPRASWMATWVAPASSTGGPASARNGFHSGGGARGRSRSICSTAGRIQKKCWRRVGGRFEEREVRHNGGMNYGYVCADARFAKVYRCQNEFKRVCAEFGVYMMD